MSSISRSLILRRDGAAEPAGEDGSAAEGEQPPGAEPAAAGVGRVRRGHVSR